MTDEQQHDFTFTTPEVAKLAAVFGMGFYLLNNPKLCVALAQKLPGFAMSLSISHSLLGNTTSDNWDQLTAEEKVIRLNEAYDEAKKLGKLFADISVMAYAPEDVKQQLIAESNRPPTYDPNVS